jgi:hypothetical protein
MVPHSVIQVREDQDLHETASTPGDFFARFGIDAMASWEGYQVMRESTLIKLHA